MTSMERALLIAHSILDNNNLLGCKTAGENSPSIGQLIESALIASNANAREDLPRTQRNDLALAFMHNIVQKGFLKIDTSNDEQMTQAGQVVNMAYCLASIYLIRSNERVQS